MTNILVIVFGTCLGVWISFLIRRRKLSERRQISVVNEMNKWMKMTRDERKDSDDEAKRQSMKRKKLLLTKIREEYKQVQKSNIKHRPPFIPTK